MFCRVAFALLVIAPDHDLRLQIKPASEVLLAPKIIFNGATHGGRRPQANQRADQG